MAVAAPGGTAIFDNPAQPGNPPLAQVGPVAKNGFPAWYKDGNGTRLEPCLDSADPLCVMGALPQPDQPVTPDSVSGNFPDEFFYQAASAGLDNVGANVGTQSKPHFGKASLDASLEGAFLNGPAAPNEQMVFARLRVRVTAGLQGNSNYLFVHPYGERTVKTDPGTDNLFVTEDIGATAGAFKDALDGRIAPFLKWTDDPALPAGYTGDPRVDHTIQGGVNDYFAIIGPGIGANNVAPSNSDCPAAIAKAKAINDDPKTPASQKISGTGPNGSLSDADCIDTNLFSLMGKLAENAGVDVKRATFSRDAGGNTAVDVQAESDANQNIVVRDPSANRTTSSRMFPTTKLTEDRNGRYYAHVTVDGAAGQPFPAGKQVEVVNGTDGNPQDTKAVTPVDEILNATATYSDTPDANGDRLLTVKAESSDQADPVTLSVDNPNGGTKDLAAAAGSAQQSGTLALATAPRTVTITSSKGGTLTIPVHTDVASNAAPAPLAAAIRGPVKAVATGSTVKLFGTGSTGPIGSYAWTGPFVVNPDGTVSNTQSDAASGGGITSGAATDTATFTAPTVAGQYGYTLTVANDAGNQTATASVVLNVTGGGAVVGLGDPLTPGKQRYAAAQGRMVVDGTATVRSNNVIHIWIGKRVPADLQGWDATAIVDPVDGTWAFDTGNGGMPDPPANNCVSYISIHGTPGNIGSDPATPADEWDCLPIDGRGIQLQAGPTSGPLPPAGGAAAAAAAAPRAIAGAVPAAGAAAAPAAPAAAPRLAAAARVAAPATVNAAALATTGVPVNVTVPAGATLLRLRVLTTANTALATTFKKVKAGKKVKVTVRSATAARKLRGAKRFVVEVRAGTAKNRLGKATRKVIRIRR